MPAADPLSPGSSYRIEHRAQAYRPLPLARARSSAAARARVDVFVVLVGSRGEAGEIVAVDERTNGIMLRRPL